MKPLIYIDQNIVSQQAWGHLDLMRLLKDQYLPVYSPEHFHEISRAEDPSPYLDALDQIGAKYIELESVTSGIRQVYTGEACLKVSGSAREHYAKHLENTGTVEFDANILNPLIAWLKGGACPVDMEKLYNPFSHVNAAVDAALDSALQELNTPGAAVPIELSDRIAAMQVQTDPLNIEWRNMVSEMIKNGNDLQKTRAVFGDVKGSIGGIKEADAIPAIWASLSPEIKRGITPDQFFGFEPPYDFPGYEKLPVAFGIQGCCQMFDSLGFASDKKCRKVDDVPNVASDGMHIAMGAYCCRLLSADKRLFKRARAIYLYKSISTIPIFFKSDDEDNNRVISKNIALN